MKIGMVNEMIGNYNYGLWISICNHVINYITELYYNYMCMKNAH